MKRRLITLLAVVCLIALLVPMTVSAAAPQNGWVRNEDKTWSYYRNDVPVTDEVIKVGSVYYGFDEYGVMYDNEEFYWDGEYYRAKSGGILITNAWYQDSSSWYYYTADGSGAQDFLKLGSTWYYFYGDGMMATSTVVWSNLYRNYYALNDAGTNSVALTKVGWNQAFGHYYYLYQEGDSLTPASGETLQIGGSLYYFHYNGQMAANEIVYCYNPYFDYYEDHVATSSGALLKNGWGQAEGKWYYAEDYELYRGGIYLIGSTYYFFEDQGYLAFTPGERGDYYVKADGTILCNQWRKDTTGSSEEIGWVYYGADGRKLTDWVQKIGGQFYWFNEHGVMQTNSYVETEDLGVFTFDSNGYGKQVNGWFQDPATGNWLYAYEGCLLYNFWTINGKTYCFDDYSGYMLTNTYAFDYESSELYALGKDGVVITTQGWRQLDGCWVYIQADGTLAQDWTTIGGKTYYLTPEMITNTTEYNGYEHAWYAFGSDGAGVRLTGTGFKNVGEFRVYIKNGVPQGNQWIQYNGAWYYTWFDGEPVTNTDLEIDGLLYIFDTDGKMVTNQWYSIMNLYYDGSLYTYYVDGAGHPVIGKQTIGGKTYIFDYEGRLVTSEIYELGGAYYWMNSDGTIKATLKVGWNQIGGNWYYLNDNGRLMKNALVHIGEYYYGFDSNGVMCSGGLKYAWYDWYLFDNDGHILTGWNQVGGKWYYADPNSDDPCVYWEGTYYIDGVEYLFKDGYLQGGTYYRWDGYYTANSAGVVTSFTPYPDGFTYADGMLLYKKNGQFFTGWVGDYYVMEGEVVCDYVIEYAGTLYYLKPDGRYLKSGWYTTEDRTLYAKSGGALACSEWLKLGNTYYYFSYCEMVYGGSYFIDGVEHKFATDGKWLGQVSVPGASSTNGWKQISGKWYYYNAGRPVTDLRYVDNAWYYFDYNGEMITNAAVAIYGGEKYFFFTSSGARANYVGWKQISGQWLYFNADHSLAIGIQSIGGKLYGFGYVSSLDAPVMVTNMGAVADGKLYIFNGSGICNGPETGTGWRQAGKQWFYLINGRAVTDADVTVGGSNYSFDYDGAMVTNDVRYSDHYNGYVYYNASGVAVTKAGWLQTSKGWVYIQANGTVCFHGIYKIGGTVYVFRSGFMI